MKKALAIVAVLGIASPPTHAQNYVVNGHGASPAEVRFLVSHGAQPGKWLVDGFGISLVASGHSRPQAAGSVGRKCWYVLDVQLCE